MSRRFRKLRELRPVVIVESLGPDGRGRATFEDRPVRIHGALPEEEVRIRYIGARRGADDAVVEEVISASPDRVAAPCKYAELCSGCSLQHASLEAQLAFKEERLRRHFQQSGCEPQNWLDPITGPTLGYRRRGRLSVRFVRKKERVLVGFREKNGRYVADIEQCPVIVPAIGEQISAIAHMLDGLEGRNDIPQVEFAAGDDAAALVFRHLQPLQPTDLARLEEFGRETCLRVYLQAGGPDTVTALWPQNAGLLSYSLPEHDVELSFGPTDFVQVNAELNRNLVNQVLSLLAPESKNRVLDLFCGLGNFSLPLARQAGLVIGVEGDARLVALARDNAQRNGIGNVEFHAADLINGTEAGAWCTEPVDRILLDPPRAGLGQAGARVTVMQARRIVYVSCNGETLAEDAKNIVATGRYRFVAAGAVDMFPHTAQGEAIALFEAA